VICDVQICDEAHRLKNPEAMLTKAVCQLPAQRRLLLSGTPVQVRAGHSRSRCCRQEAWQRQTCV
jgi:hypothetical protein